MMNKQHKDNAHAEKDIIHLVVFAKIQKILIVSAHLILDLIVHVVGMQGHETIEEHVQTIWKQGSGQFSLNQGIKTCTGGSAEEPTPKGCICGSTQSEQECACQEYDQRQSCICLPIGDIRSHCIEITIPSCDQATSQQLIDVSTDICECYSIGDPRSQCSESKICDDPSTDLSNIPPTLCPCNGDNDPRRGITCPNINLQVAFVQNYIIHKNVFVIKVQIQYSNLIFAPLQRPVQDHKAMMNKQHKDNAHADLDIIHLVVFAKIQKILIVSAIYYFLQLDAHVLQIPNSFVYVVGM
ncbi:MAG: hypothetical protein EZS28_034627 [Streblomastix strix]|uniref:Uncharacterized protein n=1 Tax=Streblomastix strix TaxID=222440 RepID=A0A5J4UGC9_9EUKA|nr:MAG: hypothetical protein EZS28_034627 [Streblomastix strix]